VAGLVYGVSNYQKGVDTISASENEGPANGDEMLLQDEGVHVVIPIPLVSASSLFSYGTISVLTYEIVVNYM
jgi:hypothetical protein